MSRDDTGAGEDFVRVRIHGPERGSPLVYLPGLHGDWTLLGGFRAALSERVRLVELTYPRTRTWSLNDYAAGVNRALAAHGVWRGWLLAESFGSQVLWPLLARESFQAEAAILAGGFVRHPLPVAVRAVERLGRQAGGGTLRFALHVYMTLARWRFGRQPALWSGFREFESRRTWSDWQAILHRLRLVAAHDPRKCVAELHTPLYAFSGRFDPIVPWPPVRAWLRRHYPALRQFRVVAGADHFVLGVAARESAELVLGWMNIRD